jgi:nucleotide-binding universal stress UspA family protein
VYHEIESEGKEGNSMEGYEKILVPLDGSDVAEAVLPEIEKVATVSDASISLLRVVYVHPIPYEDMTKFYVAAVRDAEEYLRGIEERLKAKGFIVESHVRQGHEAEEILDYCDQSDIDLFAMSTHGRSGIKRWLLGSVAEKVMRHTTKPILLVRSAA